jgi:hypothetical protein
MQSSSKDYRLEYYKSRYKWCIGDGAFYHLVVSSCDSAAVEFKKASTVGSMLKRFIISQYLAVYRGECCTNEGVSVRAYKQQRCS